MKCKACDAEVGNSNFCQYCGSQITLEMKQEQEVLNKAGCPQCGSSQVVFTREQQGEIKNERGKAIMMATVGICGDCGYTWVTNSWQQSRVPIRKSNKWLWVMGWVLVFPAPIAILVSRKKDLKPAIKYTIIAIACILYLLMVIVGYKENNAERNGASTSIIIEERAPFADNQRGHIISGNRVDFFDGIEYF